MVGSGDGSQAATAPTTPVAPAAALRAAAAAAAAAADYADPGGEPAVAGPGRARARRAGGAQANGRPSLCLNLRKVCPAVSLTISLTVSLSQLSAHGLSAPRPPSRPPMDGTHSGLRAYVLGFRVFAQGFPADPQWTEPIPDAVDGVADQIGGAFRV